MQFESTPSAGGSHHLAPLLRAVRSKHPIELTYKKFSSTSDAKYKLNPYLLKEYRNRWYLLAWDVERSVIRTFGCDRIVEITVLESEKYSEVKFDADNYFKHAIGITVIDDSPPVDVVLRCSPLLASYLNSQPLHSTQTIDVGPESSIVKIRVLITFELVQWLQGFASDLEVKEPQTLRTLLADKLRKASIY
jgi:predicted DNA-binding transcriptional regulator YafY